MGKTNENPLISQSWKYHLLTRLRPA